MVGFLIILLVIILSFIGIPIAISLISSSLFYILITGKLPLIVLVQKMSSGVDSFLYVAIPLFIFVGLIMEKSGISDRLISLSRSLVGHIPGGLAHINIVVSMFFAGVSGSALADTAAIGGTLIPMMEKEGYDTPFSVAVTAASSLIGPIIPPSIPFVVFGGIASVSIGKLFLAGVVPGIIMGAYMMVISYYIAIKKGYPSYKRVTVKEMLYSIYKAIPALIMPIIIIGGIIIGWFTPTEASGVAVIYGIFVSIVVFRSMSFKNFIDILSSTCLTTTTVMFVVGGASLFGYILTIEGVPQNIVKFLSNISVNPQLILLIVCLFLLVLGMFMSVNASIVLVAPLLVPIFKSLGFNLVHIGVVIVLFLCIGLLTPPVCAVLQLACQIGDIPLMTGFKATLVFIIAMILMSTIIVFVPQIVLFLPNLLLK